MGSSIYLVHATIIITYLKNFSANVKLVGVVLYLHYLKWRIIG